MFKTRIMVFSLVVPMLFAISQGNAFARDLVLKNVQVLKITPCQQQIRFTVVNQSGPDEKQTGPYLIQVYSLNRNKLIKDFPIESQDANETLYFVVPASELLCDDRVRIRIDPENKIIETNKKNNIGTAKLERPKSGNLVQVCIIDKQSCS